MAQEGEIVSSPQQPKSAYASRVRLEAAIGFEPMHGGFADLSLNHLGTPPLPFSSSRPNPINYHARESASIERVREQAPWPGFENTRAVSNELHLPGWPQQLWRIVVDVIDLGRDRRRDEQIIGCGYQQALKRFGCGRARIHPVVGIAIGQYHRHPIVI